MHARAITNKISVMAKRPNGTGCLFKRGRLWWLKYHRLGKPYQESSGTDDKAKAENLLTRRLGAIAEGTFRGLAPGRTTISELCGLVIQDYEYVKHRSTGHVRWRSEKHITPLVGAIKANEFGNAHLKFYVSSRRASGAQDSTINRELAIIRRGFTLAYEQDPPLVAKPIKIANLRENEARQGFIEHAQYLELLRCLPPHLKALFVVGYHVGNRLGELRNLLRVQVDLKAKEIRLTGQQTKNKEPRTLPIYGDMGIWLELQQAELEQAHPNCKYFFHTRGHRVGCHLKGWREACAAAGLPNLRFHDLRRSAVRNMERAGVPRKQAMKITGHKTESVYSRYDIVSAKDMKAAGSKLEHYFGAEADLDRSNKGSNSGRQDGGTVQ
jgi:integrase